MFGTLISEGNALIIIFQSDLDEHKSFLLMKKIVASDTVGSTEKKARCLLYVLREAKLVYSCAANAVHPQGSASQNRRLKCDSTYLGVEGKLHSAQLL